MEIPSPVRQIPNAEETSGTTTGHDPGKAPVAVPGWVRLLLEAAFFGGAAWALYAAGREAWALVFGVIVLLHYAASYDRVWRLLKK